MHLMNSSDFERVLAHWQVNLEHPEGPTFGTPPGVCWVRGYGDFPSIVELKETMFLDHSKEATRNCNSDMHVAATFGVRGKDKIMTQLRHEWGKITDSFKKNLVHVAAYKPGIHLGYLISRQKNDEILLLLEKVGRVRTYGVLHSKNLKRYPQRDYDLSVEKRVDALNILRRWVNHVFINQNTGRSYERLQPAVRYMMRDLCKAARVKHFGFHSLRHYVARMLIEGGQAHIGDIQTLYGHQNATTTDIYLKSLTASPVSHVAPYIEDDVIKKTLAAASKGA